MRKWLAMLALVVLAACASTPNPVSEEQVFLLANGYGVVQTVATTYVALPRCTPAVTLVCSKQEIVDKLVAADATARVALDELEQFVRKHPTIGATDLYETAKSAIAAFKKISADEGVGK